MINQEEIEMLRNDPEIMAGCLRGLHDAHLGHMFSHKLVFGCYKETGGRFYSRWYCRSVINLKKFWWVVQTPWQRLLTHRNCSYCKDWRLNPS